MMPLELVCERLEELDDVGLGERAYHQHFGLRVVKAREASLAEPAHRDRLVLLEDRFRLPVPAKHLAVERMRRGIVAVDQRLHETLPLATVVAIGRGRGKAARKTA